MHDSREKPSRAAIGFSRKKRDSEDKEKKSDQTQNILAARENLGCSYENRLPELTAQDCAPSPPPRIRLTHSKMVAQRSFAFENSLSILIVVGSPLWKVSSLLPFARARFVLIHSIKMERSKPKNLSKAQLEVLTARFKLTCEDAKQYLSSASPVYDNTGTPTLVDVATIAADLCSSADLGLSTSELEEENVTIRQYLYDFLVSLGFRQFSFSPVFLSPFQDRRVICLLNHSDMVSIGIHEGNRTVGGVF